jgi:hypothetical protein
MSVFIVKKENIFSIVKYIYTTDYLNIKQKYNSEEDSVNDLLMLNISAYNNRYNLNADIEFNKKIIAKYDYNNYKFGYELLDINIYQVYKYMQCWLYQCSESEDIINSYIYKMIKYYFNELLDKILDKIPEYKDAKWE